MKNISEMYKQDSKKLNFGIINCDKYPTLTQRFKLDTFPISILIKGDKAYRLRDVFTLKEIL